MGSKVTITDHIAKIPLFENLSTGQRDALARVAIRRSYARGEAIFSEGDEANGFFVILSGSVRIYKLSPEGKEQILHIFEDGDPFGEVAVFSDRSFPAYADAMKESSMLFFPRHPFIGLMRKDPDLSLNMLAVLSKRLRKFSGIIEALSLREVPGRLATHILSLSRKCGGSDDILLDMPKGQLASLLGTIPETLSRIIAKMQKRGLLRSEGSKIIILDRSGLTKIAEGDGRLS
ncbi:MAG: Crp/Fnr family transcriptional regulator [Deltaproteobacteria bacterium]|nr:Crp/Fnr family transcriptional regulator [Deltaproteobacteria bacterium]